MCTSLYSAPLHDEWTKIETDEFRMTNHPSKKLRLKTKSQISMTKIIKIEPDKDFDWRKLRLTNALEITFPFYQNRNLEINTWPTALKSVIDSKAIMVRDCEKFDVDCVSKWATCTMKTAVRRDEHNTVFVARYRCRLGTASTGGRGGIDRLIVQVINRWLVVQEING